MRPGLAAACIHDAALRNDIEAHHDFAYRTWGSPCCWQRLNWAQPATSLSVLVDLNTTCLVDPNVLGKHGKNSVPWPKGGSVDLLKCRFAGSYCNFKKYPSSCKDGKGPPPGPDHYLPEELPVGVYEAPREAAYDDGPAERRRLRHGALRRAARCFEVYNSMNCRITVAVTSSPRYLQHDI